MNLFAAMTAIQLDQQFEKLMVFFGCSTCVAEQATNIPYNQLFEWIGSNHFCLPLCMPKHMSKEEIKKKTIYVSQIKVPNDENK